MNREGLTITAALKQARQDRDTFIQHFQTPMSLSAALAVLNQPASSSSQSQPRGRSRSPRRTRTPLPLPARPPSGADEPNIDYRKDAKGKGKGKGGKTKGKDAQKPAEILKTPDGRFKCFRYQRGNCKDPKCGNVHVCLICNGAHGKRDCPEWQAFKARLGTPGK